MAIKKLGINQLMIMFMIMMMLFLVSCNISGKQKENNFKVGTPDILVLAFGSEKGYEDRSFILPVELHNKLGYNIRDVKVAMVGMDKSYVELDNYEENFPEIEGRSRLNPEGEKERAEFNGLIKNLLPGEESGLQNYRIFVNFNSKIEFSPTICVNPSLYPGMQDGGCKSGGKKFFDGQGAPLSVTNMEIIPGQQTELRMTLRNLGRGDVGKIIIGTATLGGKSLNCEFRNTKGNQNTGIFSAGKKEVQLVCTQLLSGKSSYETGLYIELMYDYEISFKKKLEIIK